MKFVNLEEVKREMNSYDWIIGICSTGASGVRLFKFRGTKDEVKEKLLFLVNEDRKSDPESWDYGSESLEDISAEDNGLGYKLYGQGCYVDYHIKYTAQEFTHIYSL